MKKKKKKLATVKLGMNCRFILEEFYPDKKCSVIP